MRKEITDDEVLFRAIKPFPNWWKAAEGRPSSAAFKDSRGVSVDRQEDRSNQQVVEALRARFEVKAVVSLTARACREADTYPVAAPLPDNPWHAEIRRSASERTLTSGQARKLSRLAKIEYQA